MEETLVEKLRFIIRDMEALALPRTLLTHGHRTYSNALLGRDLILVVARAEKGLSTAIQSMVLEGMGGGSVVATSLVDPKKASSRAGKFLETLQVFFQMCLQAEVMVCVNTSEKMFVPDCFYLFVEKEPPRDSQQEADVRRLLETLQVMRRSGDVELKDRRNALRGYSNCFVREDAVKWLKASGCPDAEGFLTRSLHEGLLSSVLKGAGFEWLQFVPRVVHSGFAYVGGPGEWVRRWLVLRECSLLIFNENRKQQVSEVPLTQAAVDRVGCEPLNRIDLARDQYAFSITTPTERLVIMMNSLCECDLWVEYIMPFNATVREENELIQQAEAIICSTTYHANVL